MTVELRRPRPERYTVADPPPFVPHVRPMRGDELPWVIHSWSEGHKDSPDTDRMRWPDYKALRVPMMRAALERADTAVLVCDGPVPGRGVGWLTWSRWPSIDIVHWAHTAMQFRRRGVFNALIERALGDRKHVVYTHEAAKRRGKGQVRFDAVLVEKLRARGAVVSYIPFKEWSK